MHRICDIFIFIRIVWTVTKAIWKTLAAIGTILGLLYLWPDIEGLPEVYPETFGRLESIGWLMSIEREMVAFVALALALTWILWMDLRPFAKALFQRQSQTTESNAGINKFGAEVDRRPRPMFSIVTETDKTWIRIDNSEADATFTVKVSYPDRGSTPLPETPVHAQWADNSMDTSRFIQAGGYDGVILFRSELGQTAFLKTLIFSWISRGHQFERQSTSWVPMKGNDTVPPSGKIDVFISSDPTMVGGSQVLRLGFEGDQVSVISGEVSLQTDLN